MLSQDDLSVLQLLASPGCDYYRKKVQLHDQVVEKKKHTTSAAWNRSSVQLELLPAADPKLKGLTSARIFFPTEEVSGDYYVG